MISFGCERLTFGYANLPSILDDVSLTAQAGELVAITGPSGRGKSTLLYLLGLMLSPRAGAVLVDGDAVSGLRDAQRSALRAQLLGFVFQDADDQLFMPTVRDDVAFGPANLGLRGAQLQDRVGEALAAVGMAAYGDRPPHHLSFGQRRRVAVATVLAMRPEILVLDEPSSNLDPVSRRELAQIILGLDVTVLMVTHDLPYALQLCERSIILSDGAIVADGPTGEVLADAPLMAAHRLELPFGFDPSAAR